MRKKVVFIDRDGVINIEVGYLHKADDFKFIDYVFESLKLIQNKGFEIIIVTNQSGIARGIYTENEYHNLNAWMIKKFKDQHIKILDTFYCPHGPNDSCKCRKPNPGMIYEAKKKHSINLSESWMIGDKESDIQAGHSAGINKTILVRSGHAIDEKNTKALFVVDSIKECAEKIIQAL